MNPFKKHPEPRGHVLVLVCLIAGLASPCRATVPEGLYPVPHDSRDEGWLKKQKARFFTTPLLVQAQRLSERGAHIRAQELLREAQFHDTHNILIKVRLAENAFLGGQLDEASSICKDVLQRHPDYTAMHLLRGEVATRAGNFLAAQAAYEQALDQMSPYYIERAKVYAKLVDVCRRAGDHTNARRYAMQWVRLEDTPEVRNHLVEVAVDRGDWVEAERHLAKSEKTVSDQHEAGMNFLRRGYLLSRNGQVVEARELFLKARDQLPQRDRQLEIEQQLGQLAYRQASYRGAADHFKACLLMDFDENTAVAYLYALNKSQQKELALAEANAILQHRELSPEVRRDLLLLKVELAQAMERRQDEAEAWLELYQESAHRDHLLKAVALAGHEGLDLNLRPMVGNLLAQRFDHDLVAVYYQLLKTDNRKSAPPTLASR